MKIDSKDAKAHRTHALQEAGMAPGQSCEEGTVLVFCVCVCVCACTRVRVHVRELGHAGGVHISEFLAHSVPSLHYFQRFKNAQAS